MFDSDVDHFLIVQAFCLDANVLQRLEAATTVHRSKLSIYNNQVTKTDNREGVSVLAR
jgi:hypothetical protein